MAVDYRLTQGRSDLANGKYTVYAIPKTIVSGTLAAWLAANTTGAEPFSMAYNGQYIADPSNAAALFAWLDFDAKWYDKTGTEVA